MIGFLMRREGLVSRSLEEDWRGGENGGCVCCGGRWCA